MATQMIKVQIFLFLQIEILPLDVYISTHGSCNADSLFMCI